ncbi:MAG: cyclic nucleotide-binding domain-containing protein [Thermoanaerobaculia bacterium]|nr:MAG: cyclic nucleotide-binding domain-containing protein [Thermoanaerobaculia bacterium]
MLRKFFGKREESAQPQEEHSIEDLIVLERWDEAIERLQSRIRAQPQDLYSHLKLADAWVGAGKGAKALDEYLLVADSYTQQGFHDRAAALLTRVARLAPEDEQIQLRLQRLQRLKQLEHSRVLAIEGLLSGQEDQDPLSRLSPLEAQQIWESVAASDLVKKLGGDQLKRLFAGAALMVWEKGELVAERGSSIERMFLVVRGQLEAFVSTPEGKVHQLRVLTIGDLFGERALLEHRPWAATVRVLERARLLRIDRAGLERALVGNPDPRQLLEALRSQRHDRELAAAVEKLLASGG